MNAPAQTISDVKSCKFRKVFTKEAHVSGSVSGGRVSFDLRDSAIDAAIFSKIYRESMKVETEKANAGSFEWSGYNLSPDNKMLTLTITRQRANSANALIALIGTLTSFLTGVVYNPAPEGTVVCLTIKGD